MTKIYFVRHAEPNFKNTDDATRELTEKGLQDRLLVSEFLRDKGIDVVLSSPFKRAIDTVKPFADEIGLSIEEIYDFRERRVDSVWFDDFKTFSKNQWSDFNYKLSDGECLKEVQERNINVLFSVLEQHPDKNIAVGSHGTAISVILNYFDRSFSFESFEEIKSLMPWIVCFSFDDKKLVCTDRYKLI